jgi:NhaP-type Na+/H+ and K+/H+ antiporter
VYTTRVSDGVRDIITGMGVSLVHVIVAAAVLLLASVLASRLSSRIGVPALLLFMAVGMLAGSDGPGGIPFDNPALAQGLGVLALAFILFSGGLDTSWEEIRPVARTRAGAGHGSASLMTAGLTGCSRGG